MYCYTVCIMSCITSIYSVLCIVTESDTNLSPLHLKNILITQMFHLVFLPRLIATDLQKDRLPSADPREVEEQVGAFKNRHTSREDSAMKKNVGNSFTCQIRRKKPPHQKWRSKRVCSEHVQNPMARICRPQTHSRSNQATTDGNEITYFLGRMWTSPSIHC